MKEKIKDILENYYAAIEDSFYNTDKHHDDCANDLFELFVKSNPNADWEETLKDGFCKCTCSNSLQYSNCDKNCERVLDEQ